MHPPPEASAQKRLMLMEADLVFLPDPGVPGVWSMGPRLPLSLYNSAGNLFKIIFRTSAEQVKALPINFRYIYKRVFPLADSPSIYSLEVG